MSIADPLHPLLVCVTSDQDGKRADAILASGSGLSRNHIQQLLKDGFIRDGNGCLFTQPSRRVREGEQFTIDLPPTKPLELSAEDIPLDILFEDEHLLVINKPAGMVVHPSHGHDQGTLVHALLHHCPNLPGINGVERPGIVHRLDKDTSGSLLIAKTEISHRRLTEMFAAHDLDRQYVAWCRGNPSWRVKRIELPVGRHPQQRQKMAVVTGGREAITDATVEHIFGPFSQLRLQLHTGRTHQIRVHLSHEKLPILGDPVYGRSYNPGSNIPEPTRGLICSLTRQALHAEVLAFKHPITDEALHFTAPLPDDLRRLSLALKQNYG
ncbi:ribosomal large subunit pseudouridine synthase D [Mariprofundus ferrinatatus]|uniref:Pseudouridine synthase n=1 Tax=Mariprofundus ferrinatatus TaxID=1921087 RepID=A0A2K8L2S7_9PROT|nr:RluA family pseudouridine synthase [Mariprofundus ferrinatatus]ATX81597.1 ribosomal large subunit pseudouridine synthase D [Mariprofundus ferrinatatus]